VQLPTRDSATNLLSAVSPDGSKGNLTPVKGRGEGEGIRALKEGLQVPGALKGGGAGSVPYGVPGGISDGIGTTGGGTGTGSGGGGYAAIRGRSNADYLQYLKLIEKRVYSVWRYPDGVTGVQKVSVRFTLDKVGRVTQADVLDSSDARINASALEAIKRASPFPPIPESLKDLAGEPLIIRFTVAIRLKG
jgi:protein TonB